MRNFLSKLSFYDITLSHKIYNKNHHITYLASRTNVKNIELFNFSSHRGELKNEKEVIDFYNFNNKFYLSKDIKFYMNIPVSKYFLDFTKNNNIKNICVSNIEKNNLKKEHPNYVDIDLLIPEFFHADSYNKNSTKHKFYDNVKLDMYIDKYYSEEYKTLYYRKFTDDLYLFNVFYPVFNNITINIFVFTK